MDPVDKSALDELKSIMGDDFQMLIDVFLSDSEKRIIDMQGAISSQNSEALRTSAHSFKGSALNISATTLTEHCKQLEMMGKDNQLEGALDIFEKVKDEFVKVRSFLEAL
jgi:HPt (histidine-containing phosphotransfer) domain-containing protein